MTQLIITLLIVFVAAGAAVFLIIKWLRRKPKPSDNCKGCSSDCGECGIYGQIKKG
jgi:hypothetical protein